MRPYNKRGKKNFGAAGRLNRVLDFLGTMLGFFDTPSRAYYIRLHRREMYQGPQCGDLTLGCKHVNPTSSFHYCANPNKSLEVSELLVKARINNRLYMEGLSGGLAELIPMTTAQGLAHSKGSQGAASVIS